jgi:hypothetical protein
MLQRFRTRRILHGKGISEYVMCPHVAIVYVYGPARRSFGFLRISLLDSHKPEIRVCLRAVRIDADGALESRPRIIDSLRFHVPGSKVYVSLYELRINFDSLFEVLETFLNVSLPPGFGSSLHLPDGLFWRLVREPVNGNGSSPRPGGTR